MRFIYFLCFFLVLFACSRLKDINPEKLTGTWTLEKMDLDLVTLAGRLDTTQSFNDSTFFLRFESNGGVSVLENQEVENVFSFLDSNKDYTYELSKNIITFKANGVLESKWKVEQKRDELRFILDLDLYKELYKEQLILSEIVLEEPIDQVVENFFKDISRFNVTITFNKQ